MRITDLRLIAVVDHAIAIDIDKFQITRGYRGAKPPRRYELLAAISLLSPEYLLSFERWPVHTEPPDHYTLLSYLVDLYVSQSSTLMLLHSAHGYHSC